MTSYRPVLKILTPFLKFVILNEEASTLHPVQRTVQKTETYKDQKY